MPMLSYVKYTYVQYIIKRQMDIKNWQLTFLWVSEQLGKSRVWSQRDWHVSYEKKNRTHNIMNRFLFEDFLAHPVRKLNGSKTTSLIYAVFDWRTDWFIDKNCYDSRAPLLLCYTFHNALFIIYLILINVTNMIWCIIIQLRIELYCLKYN